MPDLHDLAPTVDLDSAWHIFERTARQRRRTRRRTVAAITAAAMIAVAVAITVVSESNNRRGIEVAGSGAADDSAGWSETHGCVEAFSVADRGDGCAVAEVRHDQLVWNFGL